MKTNHLIFIVFLVCIPAACSAVTIIEPPCGHAYCGTSGYSWTDSSESTPYMVLTITSSGEYAFARANFPEFRVRVESSGVTLDGKGVTMQQIRGKKDLNLKNIHVNYDGEFGKSTYFPYAISECYDIVNSSIVVSNFVRNSGKGSNQPHFVYGIGELYGTIDKTTTIAVTLPAQADNYYYTAVGFGHVYGTISGGTFTVTNSGKDGGQANAVGVHVGSKGTISIVCCCITCISVVS